MTHITHTRSTFEHTQNIFRTLKKLQSRLALKLLNQSTELGITPAKIIDLCTLRNDFACYNAN